MLEKYGDDFSTHPAVDSNLWADTFSHHKMRQNFVGRSLDLGGFVSASSAEFTGPSNILATSEEAIKKAESNEFFCTITVDAIIGANHINDSIHAQRTNAR